MKHGIIKWKLSRCTEHRLSMLKNLSISLINHEDFNYFTEGSVCAKVYYDY